MFSFFRFGPMLIALRSAIASRSIPSIEAAAIDLAELVGIGREAKSLVEVMEAARTGNIPNTIRAAGMFLIQVANAISVPTMGTAEKIAVGDADRLSAIQECCAIHSYAMETANAA